MNPFISYAQNCEDVMLRRALQHVTNGFYIDCGAFDPEMHSVTKTFYDDGWRGINIEPLPERNALFEAARPRDVNINVGASDQNGQTIFYEVVDTGLSTLSADIARRHEQDGFQVKRRQIETRRVADIIESAGNPEIHFLKIDVEGAERAVLAGSDLTKYRPWIVVVEAIVPFTGRSTRQTETSFAEWESLLNSASYDFVYFDGLNRFYVAAERAELKAAFSTPPEFFTESWEHSDVIRLRRDLESQSSATSEGKGLIASQLAEISRQASHITQLQSEIVGLQLQVQSSQADIALQRVENEKQIHHLFGIITAIRDTLSWRLTRPFRRLIGRSNDWPIS